MAESPRLASRYAHPLSSQLNHESPDLTRRSRRFSTRPLDCCVAAAAHKINDTSSFSYAPRSSDVRRHQEVRSYEPGDTYGSYIYPVTKRDASGEWTSRSRSRRFHSSEVLARKKEEEEEDAIDQCTCTCCPHTPTSINAWRRRGGAGGIATTPHGANLHGSRNYQVTGERHDPTHGVVGQVDGELGPGLMRRRGGREERGDFRGRDKRTALEIVDKTRGGSLRQRYGRHFTVSLSRPVRPWSGDSRYYGDCRGTQDLLDFLLAGAVGREPEKNRGKWYTRGTRGDGKGESYKAVVHWRDGAKEPLDALVPLEELGRDALHIEVKDQKSVHWR